MLASHGHQVSDGLDGADLVVRVHDAHQDGVRPQRFVQGAGVDQPETINRQTGHLKAIPFE